LRYFDKNQSITGQVPRFKVAALAAMRRFEQGEQYAGKGAEEALLRQFERISMAADQGNFKLAKSYALRAASKAEQSNRTVALNFKAIDLIVRSIDESDLPASVEYKDYFGTLLEDIRGARGEDRAAKEGFALAVLYTAMRTGAQLDRGQLRDLNQIGAQSADVRVRQMQVLVKAQELLRTGDSESAIDLVEPLIKGDELFQARVTLRDSYEKAKKHEKALEQNRWIARHRGRAYAELFAGFALQAANAVETNKAHLHAARTYEEIGEKSKSTAQLEKFRQLWPNASTSTYLRRNLTET
jgi:tetratricopeptide (TPR) repeat protein